MSDPDVSETHQRYATILGDTLDASVEKDQRANRIYPDDAEFVSLDVTSTEGVQKHTFVKFKADRNSMYVNIAVENAIHTLGTYGIVASKEDVRPNKLPRLVIDLDQDGFAEKLAAFQDAHKHIIMEGMKDRLDGGHPSEALNALEYFPRKPDGTALDPELAAGLVTQAYGHLKDMAQGLGTTTHEAFKKAAGEGRQRSML